jgi:hypothetical protein
MQEAPADLPPSPDDIRLLQLNSVSGLQESRMKIQFKERTIFEVLSVAKNVVAIERRRPLNAKIALTALGVAIIATPALAQRLHRSAAGYAATQSAPVEH